MDEKLTGLGSTREPVTKPQIRLPASRLLLPRSGLERLCALGPTQTPPASLKQVQLLG